jgi:hypothetical protein
MCHDRQPINRSRRSAGDAGNDLARRGNSRQGEGLCAACRAAALPSTGHGPGKPRASFIRSRDGTKTIPSVEGGSFYCPACRPASGTFSCALEKKGSGVLSPTPPAKPMPRGPFPWRNMPSHWDPEAVRSADGVLGTRLGSRRKQMLALEEGPNAASSPRILRNEATKPGDKTE